MKKEKKRIIAEVDPSLHRWIKIHCARLGMSMTDWLIQVVMEHMEKLEDKE